MQLGIDITDLASRLAKSLARLAAKPEGDDNHQRQDRQTDQAIDPIGCQHVVGQPEEQQPTAQHLQQRKANRLLDRADIVGDATHQLAGFVFAVKTERELMKLGKKLDL